MDDLQLGQELPVLPRRRHWMDWVAIEMMDRVLCHFFALEVIYRRFSSLQRFLRSRVGLNLRLYTVQETQGAAVALAAGLLGALHHAGPEVEAALQALDEGVLQHHGLQQAEAGDIPVGGVQGHLEHLLRRRFQSLFHPLVLSLLS